MSLDVTPMELSNDSLEDQGMRGEMIEQRLLIDMGVRLKPMLFDILDREVLPVPPEVTRIVVDYYLNVRTIKCGPYDAESKLESMEIPIFLCKRSPILEVADHINVDKSVLEIILRFLIMTHDHPSPVCVKPLPSADLHDATSKWNADFADQFDQEATFKLITAANYLDVPDLLDLMCAKVAALVKGKTPEQIRKTFNINDDFTPEEEEAVRAENKWAEES